MFSPERPQEHRGGWRRADAPPAPASATPATPAPTGVHREDYDDRKRALHNRLVDTLNVAALAQLPEPARRDELRPEVERLVDAEALPPADRGRLVGELLDEVLGL